MIVLEVNNLTMEEDRLNDYLIVPDYSSKRTCKYPLSMGRLDLLWIVKIKQYYTVTVLPFIDMTQEEYDALIEWIPGTIYRIIEDGKIVTIYFNGIDYPHDGGESKQISLINDATLYMDESGVIYDSIMTSNTSLRVYDIKEGAIVTAEIVEEDPSGN